MIVACPNCKSKYNLPEEKIAPNGSKVRCARCKHVFTVMPPAKDFDKELAELAAAESKAAPAAETGVGKLAAERPAAERSERESPAPESAAPQPREPEPPAPEPAAAETPLQKMPWEENDETEAGAPATPDEGAPRAGDGEDVSLPAEEEESGEPAARDSGGGFDEALAAETSGAGGRGEDELLGDFGDEMSAETPATKKSSKKKWIALGLVIAVLAVAIGAGIYFRAWNSLNIPFLSSPKEQESGDAADKVKDIALRNVRQYYIPNEKAGNVFVVEGKAVNNFPTPKERIKVEVSLYDDKGHVLAAKQLLCGNTLSQFQLQVQSQNEIDASLSSEVGVLTSNTYLKTGMDTPFMSVFFKPPESVKEFGVKVIDAKDPK